MDAGRPDGEYFADEAVNPIPSKETWDNLTTSQLIDVKMQLEEKAWAFQKQPTIRKTLELGIAQITALISSRGLS